MATVGVHPRVMSTLLSTGSSVVDVGDHGVGVASCRPLFHSLLALSTLDTLVLSGNRLKDESMVHLGTLLSHTPTLTRLDIGNTAITHVGLQHLHTTIMDHTALTDRRLGLRHLDISHNNLGPTSATLLASFLALCPQTTHLHLEDIGISSYSLEIALCDAITSLCKLASLSLSRNNIDCANCSLSVASVDLSSTNTSGFQYTSEVHHTTCTSYYMYIIIVW